VIADEAYLTDSMIDPRGKVVKGFKPIMPTYKGRLAAPEAAALVEFIKSLRSTSLENLPSKEATYDPAKPTSADSPAVYPAVNYLNADRGVKSWLLTLDHKRIGIMYFASVLVMFLVGGIFAMAVRLELLTPGPTIMGANTYNRMFTLHGIVMIFLFMIRPSRRVRQLLHAVDAGGEGRRIPELNLLSLYLYWTGAILAISAIIFGGIDTGWTFYPPYSTTTPMTVFPVVLGHLHPRLLVDPHRPQLHRHHPHAARAGLTWMRMQLFVWAIYATSIIQVLATPVIGLTVMLVGIEKIGGFGLFDATKGGDPVLFQHFFWFYSHPAVYIMVLPSMGVDQRRDRRGRAQERVRLQDDRVLVAGHRVRRLLRLGPPHVRVGPVALRQRRVRRHLDVRRRVHRHQGVQLGRHAVPRRHRGQRACSSTSAASCSSSCSAA
jgi:hypothetical protein